MRVSGLVWMNKKETDPELLSYLRETLTIVPRKAKGYDDVDSTPIRCYQENSFEFGVPRNFWFKTAKKAYGYDWDIQLCEEWADPPKCLLTHTGRYEEQWFIIKLLEEKFKRALSGATQDRRRGLSMGATFHADTGFGKTDTGLGFMNLVKRNTLVIVHKEFLMTQWKRRAEKWFPGIQIGIVREKTCDFRGKHLVIAMVHSLALDDGRYPKEFFNWPDVLILDECFPGEQRIVTERGSVPISEVRVGDIVANAIGFGRVEAVMKKTVSVREMVTLSTSQGDIVCTRNHPFLTKRGWISAGELVKNDVLIDFETCIDTMSLHGASVLSDMREDLQVEDRQNSEVLLSKMLRSCKGQTSEVVRRVRGRIQREKEKVSFLFDILSTEVDEENSGDGGVEGNFIGKGEGLAQGESLCCEGCFRAYEVEESDEVKRCKGEGLKEEQRASTLSAGRQWSSFACFSENAFGCAGERVECGVCGQNWLRERKGASLSLQDRYCESKENDCCGSGRIQPQFFKEQREGYKKTEFFRGARVEGVSFFKSDGFGESGSGSAEIDVYNLTVSGHPSYVLDNGCVVHNCHRIGAQSWAPVPQKFPALFRLGMTATPRRRDGADNVFWWHVGEIAYSAKTRMPRPNVRMIKVENPSLPPVVKRESVKSPIVINILVRLKKRNKIIVDEMIKALGAPTKRKLFVLSERLEHLRGLEEALQMAWQEKYPNEELTTDFYVGQWFTGEVRPKLAKRTWSMKDGGRERAIDTIFKSLRRKWKTPEKERPYISDGGVHCLHMTFGEYASTFGIVTSPEDSRKLVHVVLEDLENAQLYELAKVYDICQEKTEKKKRRTEEELIQAEKARVIFATYQMCAEGVDIPALDTEFLVSPIGDVEQALGRVRRACLPEPKKCEHYCGWRAGQCEGKPALVVCDLVDLGIPLSAKRERYRREYYDNLGVIVAG